MVMVSIIIIGSSSFSESDSYGVVVALELSCMYLDYLGQDTFLSTFKWKFCKQRSCCAESSTAIFIHH